MKPLLVALQFLLSLDADIQTLLGMIAMPARQKTVQRGGEKAAKSTGLSVRLLQGLVAKELGQKIMQGILGIVVVESTAANEAVERVVILAAQFIQSDFGHLFVTAAKP